MKYAKFIIALLTPAILLLGLIVFIGFIFAPIILGSLLGWSDMTILVSYVGWAILLAGIPFAAIV